MINYNGELGGMGQWDELTEESFADEGLILPENAVIVWPYMNGRAAALAPTAAGGLTIVGLLSKIAGAIGLLALAKLLYTNKPDEVPEEAVIVDGPPIPVEMPVTKAIPLWKKNAVDSWMTPSRNRAKILYPHRLSQPTFSPMCLI